MRVCDVQTAAASYPYRNIYATYIETLHLHISITFNDVCVVAIFESYLCRKCPCLGFWQPAWPGPGHRTIQLAASTPHTFNLINDYFHELLYEI